jgi:hypothetical protein
MKKQIIYALIAFVLLALGAGFWAWKKQVNWITSQDQIKKEEIAKTNTDVTDTSDTFDWKTYRNEKFGFEVKYPSVFKINDKPTDSGHIVSFMEFDEKAKNLNGQITPGYFPVISIYKWDDINDSDLKGGNWEGEKKYVNFQDFISDSEHTSINVIDETNIDGIKAYILSMPGEIGYEAIMFEYGSGFYRVSFPWAQKQLDENIKKQFLSLIRLTK